LSYLVDTNIISVLLRHYLPTLEGLRRALGSQVRLVLSPVADFEVRRGLIRNTSVRATQRYHEQLPVLMPYTPLLEEGWFLATRLWADCHRLGEPRPDADILIAAQALRPDAVLVTDNIRHFACFESHGLRLENGSAG